MRAPARSTVRNTAIPPTQQYPTPLPQMTIFPTSIRAKLTLTAVAVMGVLFLVLGAVVEVAGRQQVMSGVDAELTRHADEFIQIHKELQRNRPPPPRPAGPGEPGDGRGPDGPGPDGRGPDGRGPDERGPGGQGGEPGHDQRLGPQPVGNHHGPFGNGPMRGGPERGPGGPGPDGNQPPASFQRAVQRVGDPLLAIQPRFVSVTPGPPFARPDMMVPYDKSVLAQAERRGVVFSMLMLGNEKVRLITKLAVDDNGRKWIVQYPHPLRDIDQALRELNQTLLILLPFGLLLTAMACLFLMKRIMRPIREITTTAESIGAEDLTGRLNVAGKDEFALLAGTMNGMLGRIEGAFDVQRQALEKLEAILKQQRRFTADASHELKTPLAVIKANTGLMLHGMNLDADTKNSVAAIDSAATRMNKLVQGLMVLARAESGQPSQASKRFDLNIAVQNAIDQVPRPSKKSVTFTSNCDEISVDGCEGDIERVFVNLVDNACRHTPEDGSVRVTVNRLEGGAEVIVQDNGEGISPEHLAHLFDRFYRIDSSRSSESGGTGLGLAICKGIVESLGGEISIESQLGKGTVVRVKLPATTVSCA